MARRAGRRAVREAGGAQGRPRLRQRAGPPLLPPRAADPRRARAPQHRAAPRRGHHRGRPSLLRDGARGGRAHRPLLRRAQAPRPGAAEALRGRVLGGAARAPQPGGPPRPQAEQHPGHRRGRSQAPGLRHCQAAQPGGGRRPLPGDGAGDDPGVRQSGAGPRPGDHHRDRRVLPGRHPLRAAHRASPVPGEEPRARRGAEGGLRGRAGTAEHRSGPHRRAPPARRHDGDHHAGGDWPAPPRDAAAAAKAAQGRPRRHGDGRPAEGPAPALRVGGGARPTSSATWTGARSPPAGRARSTGSGSSPGATSSASLRLAPSSHFWWCSR